MSRSFVFMLCLSSSIYFLKSQDVHFSQADALAMYFNPASAGFFNGFYRASALHRQQWNGIGKGFITTYASFDAPVYDKKKQVSKAGLGVFFYTDVAGNSRFKTTQVSFSASGIVTLVKKHFLSGGIQLSYVQKSFDLSNIQWVNQYNGKKYDASINSNENTSLPLTRSLDVGIGTKYEYRSKEKDFFNQSFKQFSFDLALFHATAPIWRYVPSTDESLKIRWLIGSQYLHDFVDKPLGVNVYTIYMKQSKFQQWIAMFLLRMKMKRESQITGLLNSSVLSVGVMYRSTGFIIPNIRFQSSHFEVGLCYDAFISVYRYMPKGMNAFEIQITYSKYRNSLRNMK